MKENSEILNGMLDSLWIKRQVEGHIVFGLYASSKKILWISLVFLFYLCILWLTSHPSQLEKTSVTHYIFQMPHLVILACLIYLAYFSDYYQSAILWVATKSTLAFLGFAFLITGIVNFLRETNDWIALLMLSILWFPSFEFHPLVLKHQKILSVFRMLITILIFSLFYESLVVGNN